MAPGWLDREEKILEPERGAGGGGGGGVATSDERAQGRSASIMDLQDERAQELGQATAGADPAGDELDRAFGGMGIRNG